MPELRKDAIIGRWVIISSERGQRPTSFESIVHSQAASQCPFCPGHEDATPPEILAFRDDDTQPNRPGWRVRVASNKYPALKVEGVLTREPRGVYDRMSGIGAHEVIIETPEHDLDMADMSIGQIREVLWAYRERMYDLQKDIRFKYILVFKNHGEAAGASLEHSHSQLIATPIVPKRIAEELVGARNYFSFRERCVFCDMIRQELNEQERVVREMDGFLSFEPFASRFPFETWVIPTNHQSSYLDLTNDEYSNLAACMKDILIRLKVGLNDPPYNFMLHTRPIENDANEYFHWHIEIIPKLTRVAGFEWGTGFFINSTPPEEAARFLQAVDIEKRVNRA